MYENEAAALLSVPRRQRLKHKILVRINNSSQYDDMLAYAIGYVEINSHTVSHIIVELQSQKFPRCFPCLSNKLTIPVREVLVENTENIKGPVILVGETSFAENIGRIMHPDNLENMRDYTVFIPSLSSHPISSRMRETLTSYEIGKHLQDYTPNIKTYSYKNIIPIS